MKRVTLLLGLLALLAVSAYAQGPIVNAKIPFEFVASGKTLPAGNYAFTVNGDHLMMKNADTGALTFATVLTRIAGTPESKQVRVTFDVSGGKHFLEAVWPGTGGDGYLIHTVKGQHTHDTVQSE